MKKSLLILLLSSSPLCAFTVSGNPDHCTSVGFNFNQATYTGMYQEAQYRRDGGTMANQGYTLDMRVPLSSWFTFSLGGSYLHDEVGLRVNYPGERWMMEGYGLQMGFRIFLH